MAGGGRALVVDDEPAIARAVAMALHDDGWEVDRAASGEEALERLERWQYDLVLLDLRLPGMSGMQVLGRIGGRESAPRVVVISAFASAEDATEASRAGAADVLGKPFTPEELRAAVTAAIAREVLPEVMDEAFREAVTATRGLIEAGRLEAASEQARRAIALHPDRPEGFHLLGACYDLLERPTEAEEMYGVALHLAPGYRPSRHNLDRLTLLHGARGTVELA